MTNTKDDIRLLVVDGNHSLHRILHLDTFTDLYNGDHVPTGGVFGVLTTLRQTLRQFPAINKIVFVWDGGRSRRRRTLYPEYKANRGPPSDENKAAYERHLALFQDQQLKMFDLFPYIGIHQLLLIGKEADDVIGYITRRYQEHKVVLSEDKDMYQLVDPTTSVYRPVKDEYVDLTNFTETIGVPRSLFMLKKSLDGDPGDNIGGIKSVGGKTVETIVSEVAKQIPPGITVTNFQDVSGYLIESCKTLLVADKRNKKRYEAVLQHIDTVGQNWEIVDVSKEPFTAEEEGQIIKEVEKKVQFVESEVLERFRTYEFMSIFEKWSWWAKPFRSLI